LTVKYLSKNTAAGPFRMSRNYLRLLWFVCYLIYTALYLVVCCTVEISIFIRAWPYQVLFYYFAFNLQCWSFYAPFTQSSVIGINPTGNKTALLFSSSINWISSYRSSVSSPLSLNGIHIYISTFQGSRLHDEVSSDIQVTRLSCFQFFAVYSKNTHLSLQLTLPRRGNNNMLHSMVC
jgi:hypothetical protein